MAMMIEFEDEQLQASGFEGAVVLVHPDPGTYYSTVDSAADANDTSTDAVVDNVMRKYRGAWERLAEM